jgi:hypothetical protein
MNPKKQVAFNEVYAIICDFKSMEWTEHKFDIKGEYEFKTIEIDSKGNKTIHIYNLDTTKLFPLRGYDMEQDRVMFGLWKLKRMWKKKLIGILLFNKEKSEPMTREEFARGVDYDKMTALGLQAFLIAYREKYNKMLKSLPLLGRLQVGRKGIFIIVMIAAIAIGLFLAFGGGINLMGGGK